MTTKMYCYRYSLLELHVVYLGISKTKSSNLYSDFQMSAKSVLAIQPQTKLLLTLVKSKANLF